jgi:hypothetical protein
MLNPRILPVPRHRQNPPIAQPLTPTPEEPRIGPLASRRFTTYVLAQLLENFEIYSKTDLRESFSGKKITGFKKRGWP